MDRLAGDVASFRPDQEAHHRGDLLGPALAAGRDLARPCGPPAEAPRTVSIEPGAMQLAVMLCGASSIARPRIMPSSPALEALTWMRPLDPAWCDTPDRPMNVPPPRLIISGTAAFAR